MNYELAKQLKDAGFPQISENVLRNISLEEEMNRQLIGQESNYICNPTLSELIEACGDRFEVLVRGSYLRIKPIWRAYMSDEAFKKSGNNCEVGCCGYETGTTPEEAVAELWLELNKK